MPWSLACDASYDMPDPAALARAGYAVVMGYLSHTPGKGLTPAYVAQCAQAGVQILPLYETTADMALGGKAAGVAAATTATAIARELGCPPDVPIVYALDKDYSDSQMAGPVAGFVDGLQSVAGPDGEYGGYGQLSWLVAHKMGDSGRLFQTYAWSGGKWLPAAQAPVEQYRNGVQLAGGTVDLCRIDTSRLTLWTPGDDMALSKDDIAAIWQFDPNDATGVPTPPWRYDAAGNPTAAPRWFLLYTLDMLHALGQALGVDLDKLTGTETVPPLGLATGAQVQALADAVRALQGALPAAAAGPLSDADVDRVAAAVAARIAAAVQAEATALGGGQ